MKWIYKLDYKYGKHYIKDLMRFIIIGMAIVSVADFAFPTIAFSSWLSLSRDAIFSGQVWRLITFVFVPTDGFGIWLFVTLYFYYIIGETLQGVWGGFRFNLYYFIGMLATIISCLISPQGYADNSYLNLSLFLAFATLAPDNIINLFFFLPIKVKWIAIFYAAFTTISIIRSFNYSFEIGISGLIAFGLSLIPYLLFFGPRLVQLIKDQIRIMKNRRQWRGQ